MYGNVVPIRASRTTTDITFFRHLKETHSCRLLLPIAYYLSGWHDSIISLRIAGTTAVRYPCAARGRKRAMPLMKVDEDIFWADLMCYLVLKVRWMVGSITMDSTGDRTD